MLFAQVSIASHPLDLSILFSKYFILIYCNWILIACKQPTKLGIMDAQISSDFVIKNAEILTL